MRSSCTVGPWHLCCQQHSLLVPRSVSLVLVSAPPQEHPTPGNSAHSSWPGCCWNTPSSCSKITKLSNPRWPVQTPLPVDITTGHSSCSPSYFKPFPDVSNTNCDELRLYCWLVSLVLLNSVITEFYHLWLCLRTPNAVFPAFIVSTAFVKPHSELSKMENNFSGSQPS